MQGFKVHQARVHSADGGVRYQFVWRREWGLG